jgi:hypothetical protein
MLNNVLKYFIVSNLDSSDEYPVSAQPMDRILLTRFLEGSLERRAGRGESTDGAFDVVDELIPAALVGRAAIALTGEADITEATKQLFASPKLQEQVLFKLSFLLDSVGEVANLSTEYERAKECAKSGGFDIADMSSGQAYTLEYAKQKGNKTASLVVMRDKDGSDRDEKSVTILDTSGDTLGFATSKLVKGVTTYLGYQPRSGSHDTVLRLGSSPAWVKGVKKSSYNDRWMTDGKIHTEDNYLLRQIYIGRELDLPIFNQP